MASLSLNWISLGEVGGLVVRPSNVCTLLLLISLGMLRLSRRIAILTFPASRNISIVFACYLGALLFSLVSGNFSVPGFALVAKHGLTFMVFLVLTEQLLTTDIQHETLLKFLMIGSALGLLFFTFAVIWLLGLEVIPEYCKAVVSGDIRALQYRFYPRLFSTGAHEAGTSLRNAICGSFCVYFFIGMSAFTNRSSHPNQTTTRIGGLATALTSAFLVLGSVSRSNILILTLGIVCFVCRFITNHKRAFPRYIFLAFSLTLAITVVAATINIDKTIEIASNYTSRVKSVSSDGRIYMLQVAGQAIGNDWLFGKGAATKFQFRRSENQFHNIFLASWYEAGILGLITSVAFYGTICWTLFTFLRFRRAALQPTSYAWLAGLAFLPIVRAQVGGQGGMLSINDWIALVLLVVFQSRPSIYKPKYVWRRKQKPTSPSTNAVAQSVSS